MKKSKITGILLFLPMLFTCFSSAVPHVDAYTSVDLNNAGTHLFVDASQAADASKNRYKTVNEAVAAAPTATSEDERITIIIADGTYREQVLVNKPYITLKSASGDASKVILSWYYGIGYVYNNIGTNGLYDANVDWSADATWAGLTKHKAGDTLSAITYYDKNGILHTDEILDEGMLGKPDGWGSATRLYDSARYFIADGITFESSFDFYVTQEEIDAGVLPEPQPGPKPDRASLGAGSTEVEKQMYVERSAALFTESDNTIIKNCIIRSKQDTLYMGSNRIFFDKCTIIGGTDYIFGGATAVFNQCQLVYAGVADQNGSGTTTAASHKPTIQYGYLFWNCTIDYRLKDKTPSAGSFGRPWSDPLGAQVTYYGTTIKRINGTLLIQDGGWTDMGTKKDEARFYEYGSVDESGQPINTGKRVVNKLDSIGTVLNQWQILEFNPRNYLKGSDGWDPMDYAKYYTDVDNVLDSIAINTTGLLNTIVLPSAPDGYEFSWASNSKYAVINSDKSAITVIRPAYGEPPVDTTITLYARNIATGYGDKKNISLQIQPTFMTNNAFAACVAIKLLKVSTVDVSLKVDFYQNGVVIKNEDITIPAGDQSINYSISYLPEGTYDVKVTTTTDGYKVIKGETGIVSGKAGKIVLMGDITITKLITVTLKTTDFTESWATPAITGSSTGFSMKKYIATDLETANLGEKNAVYKLTKDEGTTVAKNVGGYWDLLAAVKANGGTIENTDTLQFSYDFLMESTDYFPSDYSLIDLATNTLNAGNDAADPSRLVRWGIHKGWGQFNMFTAVNARVNGDNTQFSKNDSMANKWYRIVANIDLKAKTITTTLYKRDADDVQGTPAMKILNKKAFNIASAGADGSNLNYPTMADVKNGLYFAVYMDKKANTTNKMEYYFDNFELQYQDYD